MYKLFGNTQFDRISADLLKKKLVKLEHVDTNRAGEKKSVKNCNFLVYQPIEECLVSLERYFFAPFNETSCITSVRLHNKSQPGNNARAAMEKERER